MYCTTDEPSADVHLSSWSVTLVHVASRNMDDLGLLLGDSYPELSTDVSVYLYAF